MLVISGSGDTRIASTKFFTSMQLSSKLVLLGYVSKRDLLRSPLIGAPQNMLEASILKKCTPVIQCRFTSQQSRPGLPVI